MNRRLLFSIALVLASVLAASGLMFAQDARPMSPTGTAAAQVLGKFGKPPGAGASDLGGDTYQGGKWIEITYSRPLKRGRDLWGSGANYGKAALAGAPIWRAGANVSTRLKTEVPLVINGKRVPAGEYSIFIDLKENNWTFVVSSWAAQTEYDPKNKNALWGAFDYTPDKDVVRVAMKLEPQTHVTEELTWEFLNMTDTGGTMAIRWDKMLATVPFKVGS